ncbi:hypothetical protein AB9F42_20525 [Rhizobium leguminosarum]|uniref:hypothetical protein n=1 Tax=Rhizobium leguminosarum TaxID=384 RepID=UPI003F9E0BC8
MIKKLGMWIAIVVAIGIVSSVQGQLSIPNYIVGLAILGLGVIVFSFKVDSRLRALEEWGSRKDYSGIIKQLKGERHKPRHQQPESLEAGGAVASGIEPAHHIVFEDFRWFAAVLNLHLPAWAIEELNDTHFRGDHGPAVGRRYKVWYNACQVGTMQVTIGIGRLLERERFKGERSARVELDLTYLRFIPYRDARGLVYQIALLIGASDSEDGEVSRTKAAATAADALGGHLWEAVRAPEFGPSFDFYVDGPYDLLKSVVDDWKKQGIDPMVKWGGDRKRD